MFVEEINIFAGGENQITFQQVYSKAFLCEYELQLYPFDTQVSRYRIIKVQFSSEDINLVIIVISIGSYRDARWTWS